MSTDRPIPERWRIKHEWANRMVEEHDCPPPDLLQIIEELGTAESLVRDLAQAINEFRMWHSPHIECNGCPLCAGVDAVLSHVPKELK